MLESIEKNGRIIGTYTYIMTFNIPQFTTQIENRIRDNQSESNKFQTF